MSPDPTNTERQRRFRERRNLGLEPVILRGKSYSVPAELADDIERLCQGVEGT